MQLVSAGICTVYDIQVHVNQANQKGAQAHHTNSTVTTSHKLRAFKDVTLPAAEKSTCRLLVKDRKVRNCF